MRYTGDENARTYHGFIKASTLNFKRNSEGEVEFKPINETYGAFYMNQPTLSWVNARETIYPVEFTLVEDEHFVAFKEQNQSDGRGMTSVIGRYFAYADACKAARGRRVQGSMGPIKIATLRGTNDITVTDETGGAVVVSQSPVWVTASISSRMVFPNGLSEVDC